MAGFSMGGSVPEVTSILTLWNGLQAQSCKGWRLSLLRNQPWWWVYLTAPAASRKSLHEMHQKPPASIAETSNLQFNALEQSSMPSFDILQPHFWESCWPATQIIQHTGQMLELSRKTRSLLCATGAPRYFPARSGEGV